MLGRSIGLANASFTVTYMRSAFVRYIAGDLSRTVGRFANGIFDLRVLEDTGAIVAVLGEAGSDPCKSIANTADA